MKIIVTTVLITLTLTAEAQWSTPNGQGKISYNGGNVGIGAVNPGYKLEVTGTGHFTGRLSVNGAIPNDNNAAFWNTDPTGFGLYSQGGQGTHYSFHFLNLAGSTILFGGSNGNIGIGTFDANAKLKIINSSGYNSNDTGIGQDHILLNGTMPGNGGYYGGITWESGARRRASIVATQENDDTDYVGLAFFTKGTDGPGPMFESMRIAHNGNVGIGTNSPDATLTVNGQARFIDPSLPNWNIGFGMSGDPVRHLSADVVNSAIDTDPLELVYNRGAGVKIGSGAGADKFLKIYGTAYAKEVNVTLSIPGPDYVFEKDYNLLPLSELEAYITQNKHLPEVPSAKEMERDGLNLKEMNLLLLLKIEELSLHLIEQNKEIAKLKERSVSPDLLGKKVEELTLHLIEQRKKYEVQHEKIKNLESELKVINNKKYDDH